MYSPLTCAPPISSYKILTFWKVFFWYAIFAEVTWNWIEVKIKSQIKISNYLKVKFLWLQCSNNCCQKSSSNSECQFYLNDVKLLLASVEVVLIWNFFLKLTRFPVPWVVHELLRNMKRASLFRARLTCPWGRGSNSTVYTSLCWEIAFSLLTFLWAWKYI